MTPAIAELIRRVTHEVLSAATPEQIHELIHEPYRNTQ